MQDFISDQKLRIWMFLLLILLEILPGSLQHTTDGNARQKRQIMFPENNGVVNARPCYTPDRREGSCIRLTLCRELRNINYNRLRRFFCGFEGQEPKVCCPSANSGGSGNTRPPPRTPPPTTRPPRTARPTRRTTRPTTTPPVEVRVITANGNELPSFVPRGCGASPYPKNRIIGGIEAERGSWPWMAVVYVQRRGRKSPDCGGALVTNWHVVTAAHCVVTGSRSTTLNASAMSVRLGEHDLYSNDDGMNPEDYEVSAVIKHENFNPQTYENDIAVLRLARSAQSQSNVTSVCLPYNAMRNQDLTLKKAFIAGWGTKSFNGASSPVLMEVQFDIQNQTFCKYAFRNELPINDNYLCAGTLDGSKDSCQGDSGGPLMCTGVGKDNRYFLMGVVSFGKECATPGYPGVYTRITRYLDWLRPHLSS